MGEWLAAPLFVPLFFFLMLLLDPLLLLVPFSSCLLLLTLILVPLILLSLILISLSAPPPGRRCICVFDGDTAARLGSAPFGSDRKPASGRNGRAAHLMW